jgi:hypothetical protein
MPHAAATALVCTFVVVTQKPTKRVPSPSDKMSLRC